jgi:hypothetical protein
VIEIQGNLLKRPVALIVIPLARLAQGSEAVTLLNPSLAVGDESLVLETLAITSFQPGELRGPVANLSQHASVIRDALDFALHGY